MSQSQVKRLYIHPLIQQYHKYNRSIVTLGICAVPEPSCLEPRNLIGVRGNTEDEYCRWEQA
ncbi:MAG: hypothetical protein O4859_05020 [Trichodesmium sp. St18_bin1]|nr:hypothetical protein [Trichodesmium sp. St18_bin1]